MAGKAARFRSPPISRWRAARKAKRMSDTCGHAHHGTNRTRRAGAGNDQMVRHQLPLHGAGTRQRIRRFALASRKPIEEYRGGEGAGLSDAPGAGRPGHLPQARQEQGRRLRSAVAARPAAAGLRRGSARAGQPRRRMGADRRALPRARSRRSSAQQALRRAYTAFAKAVPQLEDHAGDLFRRARRQSATPRWRCPSPACISISCARRSSSTSARRLLRRTACCRSASSMAATSGAPI